MTYKILILLLFTASANYLKAKTACCPYLGPIKIIPENPSTADSIKIVTQTTTPNLGTRIFYNSIKQADTLKLTGCFFNDSATSPQTFYDTTLIGTLKEGPYFV